MHEADIRAASWTWRAGMNALSRVACSGLGPSDSWGCTSPISVQRADPVGRTRRTSPVSVQRPASPVLLARTFRPRPSHCASQEMDILPARAHNRVPTCSTCRYVRLPNQKLAVAHQNKALCAPTTFKHGTGYLQGKRPDSALDMSGLRWAKGRAAHAHPSCGDALGHAGRLFLWRSGTPGVFFLPREPNRKGNS